MKEGISTRVGRIVSGSVNALVDAVEGMAPEVVMEQAIREVDSAIDEVRAELGRVIANKHIASKRLMEANRKHEDLADKIDIALRENREDLAEAAVSQQLDLEAQVPILENAIKEAGEEEKTLEGFLTALQARRREMKDELRDVREARKQAQAAASSGSKGGDVAGAGSNRHNIERKVDKAGSAFDRIYERETGLVSGKGGLGDASKLAELEDMSRKNRIAERLAAAKARQKEGQ